jgi:hypothetical protein
VRRTDHPALRHCILSTGEIERFRRIFSGVQYMEDLYALKIHASP